MPSTFSLSLFLSLVDDENEKGLESLNLDFLSFSISIGDVGLETDDDRLRDGEEPETGFFLTNLRPVPIDSWRW